MAQAIEKAEWERYCERVSLAIGASEAEVEVNSPELGAQAETEWLPLIGISYDPKDDIFDIALEGVDHIIEHPRALNVDSELGNLSALDITDQDGAHHLVRLRDTLALPAPH
jgi:hypothetical protein